MIFFSTEKIGGTNLKIAFWSNVHQRSGVTTNLTCVASLMAMAGMGKSIMLENHYSINSLGSLVLEQGVRNRLHENGQYYDKYGIEYLLKQLYAGNDGQLLLKQTQVPLLFNRLFYLPQSYVVNRDVFDYEFGQAYGRLFECLEGNADYVFIDTEKNRNLSSGTILSDADLIVVNLCQDAEALHEFFTEYPSLIERAVFLIGSYKPELPWNYQRIAYEYNIPTKQMAVIPFNMELRDAISRGRVLQYINHNIERPSLDENAYFIRQGKKAVCMIRNRILKIKREEREAM